MKKWFLLLSLIGVVAAFFVLELDRFLTIEAFVAARDAIEARLSQSVVAVTALYFTLYVGIAALSLPGATLLTLVAGALFGFWYGTLLVSFASSIGATLAFLVARYLLRERVQARFGERLRAINEGMRREGNWYLLTLRLVPLFPFFLVNLLVALTPLRATNFYWISQLGMLPATLVYVNAGTQLSRIEQVSDVLSPALLISFTLLGLFPLLARRGIESLRRRRVYARWRRPRRFDRNLVVIGAGAAGLVSAYIAAAVRARVTLVERDRMGGDCLHHGCVPSKALLRSAKLAHEMRTAARYGLGEVKPDIDFRALMARVRGVIARIEPHDSIERYTGLGVEVLRGHARLLDPWTVEIRGEGGETRRLSTRAVVIAAGARPLIPDIPGIAESGCLSSDTLWDALAAMQAAPRRVVVLGGGPVGCELAQCLSRLGSTVTLVEMQPRLLPREDEDVAAEVAHALGSETIELLTGHRAVACGAEGERRFVCLAHDGGERRVDYDMLLCALGRVARLEGYGLEELGIPVDRTVQVNEYLQTVYPNILAAGDVAGPWQFTHTASHQAWYAAVNALFGHWWRLRVDYSVIPWVTFTDPEVARVGLSEAEARERGIAHEVTRYDIGELDRAIADGSARGFVKVLTVPGRDRILGAVIVGERAGDLLAEFVLAMKQGIGLNRLLGAIHSYPTFAEANKYVAGEWKRAHAPARVLALLERYHGWRL